MGMTSLHTYPNGYRNGYDLLLATGRATCEVNRKWTTDLEGSTMSVSEIGFLDDQDEIIQRVTERAKAEGWTPIKWWKFWRWNDTPNPPPQEMRTE